MKSLVEGKGLFEKKIQNHQGHQQPGFYCQDFTAENSACSFYNNISTDLFLLGGEAEQSRSSDGAAVFVLSVSLDFFKQKAKDGKQAGRTKRAALESLSFPASRSALTRSRPAFGNRSAVRVIREANKRISSQKHIFHFTGSSIIPSQLSSAF